MEYLARSPSPASNGHTIPTITAAPLVVCPPATLCLTERGQAQFRFPYDVPLIAELKAAIGGVTWNGTARAWTVRVRAANIRAIVDFARAHDFEGVPAAQAVQKRLFAQVSAQIAASRAPDDVDFVPPATLRGTLLPFQRAGVAYLVRARRALQGDEMGLGKTVQTLAALETLEAFPAVIVCPAGLLLNWERECQAWLPHRSVSVFSPSNEAAKSNPPSIRTPSRQSSCAKLAKIHTKFEQPEILLVSYALLHKYVDKLRARGNQAVAFDEGHKLKDRKTQCAKAARRLRLRVPIRFIITGTPMLSSPSELIEPLTILGRLDDLGGFDHFAARYCQAKEVERTVRGGEKRKLWDFSGAANLPELAGRLRATCMVRRRKRDVLTELPPRRLAMLPVEIDHRAEYDEAQRDVLRWIARRAGRDPAFRMTIAGLDEDAQIAAVLVHAQEAIDRASQAQELVRLNALRQIAAKGKLATAEEWIRDFQEDSPREKLVVFAWHREVLTALAAKFGAPVIDGETPMARRQAIVDTFQLSTLNPQPSTLCVNLQAGGLGLTLTAASNCLVLELPWTPALLDQAIDRLHRIGQRAAVTAWLMLGRRTIDYPIWQLLQRKRTITEAATR